MPGNRMKTFKKRKFRSDNVHQSSSNGSSFRHFVKNSFQYFSYCFSGTAINRCIRYTVYNIFMSRTYLVKNFDSFI